MANYSKSAFGVRDKGCTLTGSVNIPPIFSGNLNVSHFSYPRFSVVIWRFVMSHTCLFPLTPSNPTHAPITKSSPLKDAFYLFFLTPSHSIHTHTINSSQIEEAFDLFSLTPSHPTHPSTTNSSRFKMAMIFFPNY